MLSEYNMTEHEFINYLKGFLDAKINGLTSFDVKDLLEKIKTVKTNSTFQYTTYQPTHMRTIDLDKELNIIGPTCGKTGPT